VLEHILNDEDGHVDSIEEVQDQIAQMGIQIFLSQAGRPETFLACQQAALV